jgi:hypothetical protein
MNDKQFATREPNIQQLVFLEHSYGAISEHFLYLPVTSVFLWICVAFVCEVIILWVCCVVSGKKSMPHHTRTILIIVVFSRSQFAEFPYLSVFGLC